MSVTTNFSSNLESIGLPKIEFTAADTASSRRASLRTKEAVSIHDVPFIHRFVTNWLITDPRYYEEANLPVKPRNYQVQNHENMRNVYFFGGKWKSVKAKPIILLMMAGLTVPGVLFWIFEASWCWHHLSRAMVILFTYFWTLSMAFFIRAGTSDPGILPRNIHLPTIVKDNEVVRSPQEYFNTISLPYANNDYGVTVKYCSTCHIWRPPRASHCGVCNACIIGHDHHCIFLNTCIGYRNYQYFIWTLLLVVITAIFLIIISYLQIFHYRAHPTSSIHSFGQSIRKYPIGFMLALYGSLAIWHPLSLLLLHIFLTSQNLTTRDYLNYVRRDKNFVNVYDTKNVLNNLYINWIGKPRGNSLVRPTDPFHPGDIRFKKVNPLKSDNS